MFEISPRLLTVAKMATPGLKTVDIGTDHAYLPAYMVTFLHFDKILACDIGEMPLDNARNTLKTFALEDKIELRISDGLTAVLPEEAEQITVCGMGGTLICDILNAAAWVKKSGMRLILQPMTHSEDVRKYLADNGFEIQKECCVEDNKRVYCCISACYTGNISDVPAGYLYFGSNINVPGFAEKYVSKQLKRVKTRLDALSKAQRFPEEQQLLKEVIEYYYDKS